MSIFKLQIRKYWYFGKDSRRHICLSLYGWNNAPSISFRVDGGEGEVTFHIACFISVYLTLGNVIPRSWYPTYRSSNYGDLPDERAFKIYWFEWAIWWNFWMREHEWSSSDPKWRRGSVHFDRILKGKHTCQWENIDGGKFLLPFFEGVYEVEVIKKLRIDSYSRWFTRKSISFEVRCEAGIPHEGKGENSWDCGETATFGLHFPGDRTDRNTLYEAALYFWQSCMETRERYGNAGWIPRKYRDVPQNIIKPAPKPAPAPDQNYGHVAKAQ